MTAVAAPAKARVPIRTAPVGPIIDKMWALREEMRKLEAQIESKKKDYTELSEQLEARMDAEGMKKATGTAASVSYVENISADPQGEEGWKDFFKFIAKKGYWSLLQRRISDPAYREVLALLNKQNPAELDLAKCKVQVPGTLPFTKKRLNLRALPT